MIPTELNKKDFAQYPPLAKRAAEDHLALLRQLPVPFAAVLLRELSGYDWQFPAERAEMDLQLRMLSDMNGPELAKTMEAFHAIPLSPELIRMPWAAQPGEFVEKMTAYLWTVHAIDAFHSAALAYGARLDRVRPAAETEPARWCAVAVGRGARGSERRLFSKLRPHGTLFTQVSEVDGLRHLLEAAQARAQARPAMYGHWYVDGAAHEPFLSGSGRLSCVTLSYDSLGPLRNTLLRKMHDERSSAGVGPEQLRSALADFQPDELQAANLGDDPLLRRFQVRLLTEGAGTQIFSTTFVQWAGREILRRARPQTLLLRYAPRQIDRPMDDLLSAKATPSIEDPEGSLVDADMGAFYTWLNLSRLSPPERLTFLAWFEEGTEAIVIAPGMPKNVVSTQVCDLRKILTWAA